MANLNTLIDMFQQTRKQQGLTPAAPTPAVTGALPLLGRRVLGSLIVFVIYVLLHGVVAVSL